MTRAPNPNADRGRALVAAGTIVTLLGLVAAGDGFLMTARIEDVELTMQHAERWGGIAAIVVGAIVLLFGIVAARRRD